MIIERKLEGRLKGANGGWTDEWTDEWMDEWTDGRNKFEYNESPTGGKERADAMDRMTNSGQAS